MSKISLKNLTKVYEDGNKSVKEINLDVHENEFLVLVGPSGCGKSTILRMIAGLETVTAGEIFLDEQKINDIAAKNRDIAMVFQNYALYPHMTVYQNMAFSLELQKINKKEIKRKVEAVAESLEISEILKKKPAKLSGGQQQRVALGRAIIRNPKVFLMDEPLSNLDAKLRLNMRMEIIKLHKKLKTTFIFVTHDQVEAMTMGNRIAVMNDGEIMQVDTPENIYEKPQNLFVAEFIGMPKINKLHAQLSNEGLTVKTEHLDFCIGDDELKVTASDDKEVILAFRPESVEIVESGEDFVSEIDVIENLGSEKYLYLENKMALKVASSFHLEEGQQIKVKLKRDKVHIFDRQSELRIE